MIAEKYLEARNFFIYAESEARNSGDYYLASISNQRITECNNIEGLKISDKSPRPILLNYNLNVSKQNIVYLENPYPGRIVIRNYGWEYDNYDWTWELEYSYDEYYQYSNLPRKDYLGWREYTLDSTTKKLAGGILNASIKKGYDYYEKINFVLSFVQSLPYGQDDLSSGYDEYPRYPIETLFERGGDCEDTSILAAAILRDMGYDVCLLIFPDHAAVGVLVPSSYSPNYNYPSNPYFFYNSGYYNGDKKYCYVESTGNGWRLGMVPSKYQGITPFILLL